WLLNAEGGIDRISPQLEPPPNFQAIIAGEGEWILGDGTMSDGSWAFHLWNQKQIVRLKSPGRECIVHDVNGLRQCVGVSSLESEDRRKASIKKFDRWLDSIPFGESISIALDISKFYRRDHFAFLWEEGEPIDLNTIIDRTSPWILKEAIAINDKGEIVGWGFKDGWKHERAFLLRPVQTED
ncbi:MAG: hypothetical protein KC917_12855, partial [Candidatus Omnitrophica bacterium]|nr:hypothetical protein [Candidatus Omnitrophota bacterium]